MTPGGQSRIELLQGTLYFRAMSIRVLRGRDFAGVTMPPQRPWRSSVCRLRES